MGSEARREDFMRDIITLSVALPLVASILVEKNRLAERADHVP
jgi:hypothetical protein